MIRFVCPHCDKRLSVTDDKAGKVGVCPGCKGRIQLPDVEPEGAVEDGVEEVEEKAAASPIRRKEDFAPTRRPPPPRADDEDDDDLDDRPARRRKKRRRRKSSSGLSAMFGGVDPTLIIVIGAVVVGALSLIPAFIAPALSIIPFLVGLGLMLTGYVWVVVIAFQESAGTGVFAFICGIYWLIYAITNFSETKVPLAIWLVGFVVRIVGALLLARLDT
jgi:hypothetical protein